MYQGLLPKPRVCTSHICADDLTLLTNEPRDMQTMLSRLAVCARNKHLIVNTSKSEIVHFNSAGENVPDFDVGGATLHQPQRLFKASGHDFLQDF